MFAIKLHWDSDYIYFLENKIILSSYLINFLSLLTAGYEGKTKFFFFETFSIFFI